MTTDAEKTVGTIDDARVELRVAGYCVLCDSMVLRAENGCCEHGHPAEAVTGRMLLAPHEEIPRLARFNFGAFFMPPLWGPAHGQWAGAIFLPIWLFADSTVRSAIAGGIGQRIAASVVVLVTLGFQYFFARRANGLAYRRVIDHVSVEEFDRRQRIWAVAMAPFAFALLAWAIWFDTTH